MLDILIEFDEPQSEGGPELPCKSDKESALGAAAVGEAF